MNCDGSAIGSPPPRSGASCVAPVYRPRRSVPPSRPGASSSKPRPTRCSPATSCTWRPSSSDVSMSSSSWRSPPGAFTSWASPPTRPVHGAPDSPAICSWTFRRGLGASGSSSVTGTASSPPRSTPSSPATAQLSSRLRHKVQRLRGTMDTHSPRRVHRPTPHHRRTTPVYGPDQVRRALQRRTSPPRPRPTSPRRPPEHHPPARRHGQAPSGTWRTARRVPHHVAPTASPTTGNAQLSSLIGILTSFKHDQQ